MTRDPASIEPIARAAARAVARWRLARAVKAAEWGLGLGLVGAVLTAAAIEMATFEGLAWAHVPVLASWLLLGVVFAAVGALRPVTTRRAVHELDQRAGLDDRLGTALAFADDESPLARFQRADAARFAGVDVAPLFPLGTRRAPLALLGLLLLLVGVFAAGRVFDLGPRPPAPVVEIPNEADDLLAAIEAEKEVLLARGDKEGVRLLDDMSKEIKRIQVRRKELKRRIAERQKEAAPAAPPPESEPEPLPPPETPREDAAKDERSDLITAADLERLEADTLDNVQMTDAQMGELVSELFTSTRTAKAMNEEFHHHVEHELDAMTTERNRNPSMFGTKASASEQFNDKMESTDMLNLGAQSDRLSDGAGDTESKGMDMVKRDLSAESMAAHDSAHDMQHSFNEFLQDFVKDMQQTVAETALGKKPGKNAREVRTNAGTPMADKRNAMEEAGFEEMGDMKRAESGGAPPEPASQGSGGESSDSAQSGPPPDDLSDMQLTDGDPGDTSNAVKADSSGGKTSAGASGAGSGDASQQGRSSTLMGLARLDGPLDEVLGAMGEGALPTEERKQLFERLARHSVQAGLASEADDVLLDYFEQAEELISEEEELSPLFRDYATSYFEAIRPGGARSDARPRRTQSTGDEPRPVP